MIFDKPDSVELLDAVNHFLNEKIKNEVPPHLAFKLWIVENVLYIVSREITLGEKLSNEVLEDLRELIETDTANIVTIKIAGIQYACFLTAVSIHFLGSSYDCSGSLKCR